MKPTITDILTRLSDSLESNHSKINRGGCCCIASMVAREMQTNYPETKPRIRFYADSGIMMSASDMREEMKNNNMSPFDKSSWEYFGSVVFAHVVLEFLDEFGELRQFDSEGITQPADRWSLWYKVEGSLTLDEAEGIAAGQGWNSMFNRQQLPMIQRRIQLAFRDNITHSFQEI